MKCPQLSKPEATAARNQTPSVTERRKNLERNQAQSGGQFSGQKKTAVQFQPQQSLYSPYSEYEYEEITKTQFQSVREVKDKNNNQRPTQMSLCVCGSDRDSAETLMDSLSSCFSWLMLWPLWLLRAKDSFIWFYFRRICDNVVSHPPLSSCRISSVTVTLTDGGFCTTLYHCVNTSLLLM